MQFHTLLHYFLSYNQPAVYAAIATIFHELLCRTQNRCAAGAAPSQRAPRIAGPHGEFDTTMDYVVAKTLAPLIGEISPGALVQKVDIPVVDLGVSADAPRWA